VPIGSNRFNGLIVVGSVWAAVLGALSASSKM